MTKQSPETTQEALKQLNEAIKNLAMAIDYEIHLLRTLEAATKKLSELLEVKK